MGTEASCGPWVPSPGCFRQHGSQTARNDLFMVMSVGWRAAACFLRSTFFNSKAFHCGVMEGRAETSFSYGPLNMF